MPSTHSHGHRSYFLNIAWSWLNVAAVLAVGFVFVPVLIRRLGTAQYGVWALAVSLVEYLWMIDLGFRPATVKFCAEFRALEQHDNLRRLVNTALAYSAFAGLMIFALAFFGAGIIANLFRIDHPAFPFLVRAVGLTWASGMFFNIFGATLEGFQRFDLTNRSNMVSSLLRNVASVYLIGHGYGLREMGLALLGSQTVSYVILYVNCRRVYPELIISPRYISWAMALKILDYARQVMPALVGSRLAQGAMPSVVAYFKPVQFVTYFTQSQRIMDYAADAISRVGLVSAPRVSDWHAKGRREEIVSLSRTANRYCLTLWGLWACYLFVFGGNLCRVWINRDFGDQAAMLLPVFLAGYTLWMGQFISAAVLMGIGRYSRYGITLFIEAVTSVIFMAILVPRFGLLAGVIAIASTLAVSRCLILSYLFCREFRIAQRHYLAGIFTRPLVLIGCSVIVLSLYKHYLYAGDTWPQLIQLAFQFVPVYVIAAVFFVVEREHRAWVLDRARAQWTRFRAGA